MSSNNNNLNVKDEPLMDHLSSKDFQDVYEPAQDSYLFVDALHSDMEYIRSIEPRLVIEIGCGSGFVITYMARTLGGGDCYFMATDINPLAAHVTQRTSLHNNVSIDIVNTSFLRGLDRVLGNVDVLLFNPPYVPTPTEEIAQGGIAASWAGGIDGREVIDLLLPQIDTFHTTSTTHTPCSPHTKGNMMFTEDSTMPFSPTRNSLTTIHIQVFITHSHRQILMITGDYRTTTPQPQRTRDKE
eukprot:gene5755-6662_t